jgi:hypothetical protein
MEDVSIFYGHSVYFVVIWYLFPRFGMLYPEKSGNPDMDLSKKNEMELQTNFRFICLACTVASHFSCQSAPTINIGNVCCLSSVLSENSF